MIQTRSLKERINQKVWPNPVRDELQLKLIGMEDENISLKLLKANGVTVWEEQIHFWQEEYVKENDVQHLPPGLYLLQTRVKGEFKVEKIFKQ